MSPISKSFKNLKPVLSLNLLPLKIYIYICVFYHYVSKKKKNGNKCCFTIKDFFYEKILKVKSCKGVGP